MTRHKRLTRLAVSAAVIAAALVLAAWSALEFAIRQHGPLPLARASDVSTVVLDRNGRLLRAYTTSDERWRLPLTVADVDPTYMRMLLAFEDRRFMSHGGVDPLAVARAGLQAIRHRRLVSGSSTITMQVARLLDGSHDKTFSGKLNQAIRAMAIERKYGKEQILELYLRLAPFGGNLEGVRAASLAYFGTEPVRLSHGEAALLVALPQSPEARRPDIHPEAARRARLRVLRQAVANGVLSAVEAEAAQLERIPDRRRPLGSLAPHLADAERRAEPQKRVHRLTLDAGLQDRLETLVHRHATALGQGLSAAVIVVDNRSGQLRAYVGSPGLLDRSRAGAVDMAVAIRSPGSTLKPLVYALGFDAGIIHPNTLLEDRPQRFGNYRPRNFDNDWQGTVTVREALAQSLNIPAVAVLDALGPFRLEGALQRAAVKPVYPENAEPNLSVALGGVGLRLIDLASLYSALARGGDVKPMVWRLAAEQKAKIDAPQTLRLVSPVAAWYVGDILRHAPAPEHATRGRIAYKTGTSYGYRDAWSVGYDGDHTIAVWTGRPDGRPHEGLSGRRFAAPLLFDAFRLLAERRAPLPAPPQGVLHASGDGLPPPLRHFTGNQRKIVAVSKPQSGFRTRPLAIATPPDRSVLDAAEARLDGLALKVEGGSLPLSVLIDGAPAPVDGFTRELAVPLDRRGFVRITVVDADGQTDGVLLRLK